MRQGWELKKLGEVCEIQSGSGFPKKHQGQTSGSYPFYKVSDMNLDGNENQLKLAVNYIDEPQRVELGAKLFPLGAFVFPKVGGAILTNKKRMVFSEGCADNNIMGLIPKSEGLLFEYLGHWLQSQELYDWSNKANPPSITQTTVSNVKIPLPPLDEQKRIVAVLDEAFAGLETARANAEANLKNAQDLQLSTYSKTFQDLSTTSEQRKLTDVSLIQSGSGFPKKYQGEKNGLYPFYKVSDMNLVGNEYSLHHALNYIEEVERLQLGAKLFPSGACVFPKVGGAILTNKKRMVFMSGCADNNVMGLVPNDKVILPEYLYLWLQSQKLYDWSNKANPPSITQGTVANTHLPLPTLDKQKGVVERLEELRVKVIKLVDAYTAQVQNLSNLRQSLLQKAFSGELT